MNREQKKQLNKYKKSLREKQEVTRQQEREEEARRRQEEIEAIKQSIEGLSEALNVNVDVDLDDTLSKLDDLKEISSKLDKIDNLAKDIASNIHIPEAPETMEVKGLEDLWNAHLKSNEQILNDLDSKTAEKFTTIQEYLESLEETLSQGQNPQDYTPVRIVEGGQFSKLKFAESIRQSMSGGGSPVVSYRVNGEAQEVDSDNRLPTTDSVNIEDSNDSKINPRKEDGHGSNKTNLTYVNIVDPSTLFSGLETASRNHLIELKSTYGLSVLRDIQTSSGSGSVTNDNIEYNLSTGTTTSSSARLDSAERGRYIPGSQAQAGIGMRLPSSMSGTAEAKWGYYDDNNGIGFGVDSNGMFVFRRSGGTTTKTYQEDWSVDPMDGTGISGLTLDVSAGNIFQFDFSWYGYGVINYDVVMTDGNTYQDVFSVHKFEPEGEVSIQDPNLPLRAEIENGNSAEDLDMFIGGRQFSIYNVYEPNVRITSERRLEEGSVGTTFVPLITFRRKLAFQGVSAKLAGLNLITDIDLIYQFRLNPGLDNASFGTPQEHSASETALEADISATSVSGGEVIYQGLLASSGSGSNEVGFINESPVALDLPEQQPITLVVRTVSGTATISSVLRMREEW